MSETMRINKYLAEEKISSRREADALISAGRVKINGRLAKLGDQVKEGDKVEVTGKPKAMVYLAFNKPKHIITHSKQGEEKEIADIIKSKEKVFPVGRLDKSSYGLILLTNDGRLTDALLNPAHDHEKEYLVSVDKHITPGFLRNLEQGVTLEDGYKTKPCKTFSKGENRFAIILTEGKKHQIRRMCVALGYSVRDLQRTRIMNVRLGTLKPGQSRPLERQELNKLLKGVGL